MNFDRTATRSVSSYLPDIGRWHVAAYRWHRSLAAMDAANKWLGQAIARGDFRRDRAPVLPIRRRDDDDPSGLEGFTNADMGA